MFKDHRYFRIVENRRVPGGKVVPRTVLYLGEINDQQQGAWQKTRPVFDEDAQRYTTLSLSWKTGDSRPGAGQHAGERKPAAASGW